MGAVTRYTGTLIEDLIAAVEGAESKARTAEVQELEGTPGAPPGAGEILKIDIPCDDP